MYSILKPYIFSLDPEVAHDLAIKSLKANFLPESFFSVKHEELIETNLFKKKINNPIGLAAGFDKSAEVYNSLFKLGFGFVEVGTITPKRQLGNPKPRIFRLEKDEALINRLGFNNHGSEIVADRIAKNKPLGVLGINIGPNRDTKNKSEDFYSCLSKLYSFSDYITINISSPNTEGLRDFHEKNSMNKLLEGLQKIKKNKNIKKPLVIKLSPDLNEKEISNTIEIIKKYEIDGIIVSNTTDKNRDKLLDYCLKNGIEAKVHYPVPIYRQPALNHLGHKEGDFPVTDAHTHKIITFPCDQYLSQKEMNFVIQTVTDFYQKTP